MVRVLAAVVKRHAAKRSAAAARPRATSRANRAAARREARFAELAVPFYGARHNVDPLVVRRVEVVLKSLLIRRERKRKRLRAATRSEIARGENDLHSSEGRTFTRMHALKMQRTFKSKFGKFFISS